MKFENFAFLALLLSSATAATIYKITDDTLGSCLVADIGSCCNFPNSPKAQGCLNATDKCGIFGFSYHYKSSWGYQASLCPYKVNSTRDYTVFWRGKLSSSSDIGFGWSPVITKLAEKVYKLGNDKDYCIVDSMDSCCSLPNYPGSQCCLSTSDYCSPSSPFSFTYTAKYSFTLCPVPVNNSTMSAYYSGSTWEAMNSGIGATVIISAISE